MWIVLRILSSGVQGGCIHPLGKYTVHATNSTPISIVYRLILKREEGNQSSNEIKREMKIGKNSLPKLPTNYVVAGYWSYIKEDKTIFNLD